MLRIKGCNTTTSPSGQRVFLDELRALVERKQNLVPGARVAAKTNAQGDVVLAVIVPAVRIPEGTS